MIRTILAVLTVLIFFIISIPLYLIEFLIGKADPEKKELSSLRIVQTVFKILIFLCGTKLTVIGEDRIPDEPVLYIGNHRSIFDIIITYSRAPHRCSYVAKKEIEKVPFLAWWMKILHCQFLDRENPREGLKTILAAIDLIKSGASVAIYPEGTRNRGDDLSLLEFKEGAFKIATKTNCPIIPMTMNHTDDILEKHFPFIRRAHVVLEYGEPIYLNDLDKEEKKHIGSYVQNIIQETLNKNASL